MWHYADIKTIADIPRFYGRTKASHPALIEGERKLTYAELDAQSNRMANVILAQNIPAKSRVGIYCQNRIEYWALVFAIHKAGCVAVPLNWRLAIPELAVILEDAGCNLVFYEESQAENTKALAQASQQSFKTIHFNPEQRDGDELSQLAEAVDNEDPQVSLEPMDPAFLMYTSGTTGKPKGVQLTHQGLNYMRLCEHFEPILEWQPDDVKLMVMPNFHLVGTGLTLQALYNGVTISMLPVLDPGKMCKLIQRDKPTVTILVPTAIQMLLDHPEAANTDFTCLRLVMYAGSAITATLLKRAMQEMTPNMMQFYGATETSGAATLLRPEQHDLEDETKLKSCGTPLPLIDIKIVDEQRREVPQGQVGELAIRSPSLANGYWQQSEKTEEAFQRGWYYSGDAGFRDADGLYYLVDRVKDMIVTGGENVYSAEVEQVLVKHPAVSQCAVIGLPHEKWGEQVTAIVVRMPDQTVETTDVIAHCREHIAAYKAPKEVYFVDALPLTPSGKVQKKALKDEWLKRSA